MHVNQCHPQLGNNVIPFSPVKPRLDCQAVKDFGRMMHSMCADRIVCLVDLMLQRLAIYHANHSICNGPSLCDRFRVRLCAYHQKGRCWQKHETERLVNSRLAHTCQYWTVGAIANKRSHPGKSPPAKKNDGVFARTQGHVTKTPKQSTSITTYCSWAPCRLSHHGPGRSRLMVRR